MKIKRLNISNDLLTNLGVQSRYKQFNAYLEALSEKDVPEKIVSFINDKVDNANKSKLSGDDLRKSLFHDHMNIVKYVQKELNIVPDRFYRKLWIPLSIFIIGLPIGVVLYFLLGSFWYLLLGFPLGWMIGSNIGKIMDQKAAKEGRQLNVQMKY